MGVVYLAEDITLGRRVAMKFLSTTTKEYRARFLREARAVSALTHPNIATVFDYGETAEGQPYIVMELIKGQPLNEKLREGSLPLAGSCADCVVHCRSTRRSSSSGSCASRRETFKRGHNRTRPGQGARLWSGQTNYRTARHWRRSDQKTLPSTRTRSDVIVGTPLYLSPEQATGKNVDGRSDLFALGAVLYECITGQSAFARRQRDRNRRAGDSCHAGRAFKTQRSHSRRARSHHDESDREESWRTVTKQRMS